MKIKIAASAAETLKELRAKLAARLRDITKSTGDLDNLIAEQEKFRQEIELLESSDSTNENTASKLATKRVQLEQIQKKIEKLSSVAPARIDAEQTADSELLREFARQAASATAPSVKAYAQELADKIRPWCNSDESALRIASQTPAATSLMNAYRWPFGSSTFSVSELKSAVARADEILSGELNWKWDAKIS